MLRKEDLSYRGTKTDQDGLRHYSLIHTAGGAQCPSCGASDFCVNGYVSRSLISLGPDGEKVIFDVTAPRFRCRKCGKSWTAPLAKGKKYTDTFRNIVAEEVLEDGLSLDAASKKFSLSFSTARRMISDYLDEEAEKIRYRLPETLVVYETRIRKKAYYMIIDPIRLMLLDLIDPENPERLSRLKAPGTILFQGTDNKATEKRLRRIFPETVLIPAALNVINRGTEAIIAAAVKKGLDENMLREYLAGGKDNLIKQLGAQSLEIINVKEAYDYLTANAGSPVELKKYKGFVGLVEFAQTLPDQSLPETVILNAQDMEYLNNGINALEDEIEHYRRKKNSGDKIRQLVLLNELSTFPIEGTKEKRSFGRLLKERNLPETK